MGASRADEESAGPSNTNVKLRYNGEIVWDSPAITKSTCVVDVSYFPFDWQQCNLTFGSWTYNGNQVGSALFYFCMYSFFSCTEASFQTIQLDIDPLCCSMQFRMNIWTAVQ